MLTRIDYAIPIENWTKKVVYTSTEHAITILSVDAIIDKPVLEFRGRALP